MHLEEVDASSDKGWVWSFEYKGRRKENLPLQENRRHVTALRLVDGIRSTFSYFPDLGECINNTQCQTFERLPGDSAELDFIERSGNLILEWGENRMIHSYRRRFQSDCPYIINGIQFFKCREWL